MTFSNILYNIIIKGKISGVFIQKILFFIISVKRGEAMAEYAKTLFSDVSSIKSVITIFPFDLTGLEPIGETHDFWEFIYVNEGVFEVLVDNKPYVVKEGQMITYAPLSFHKGAKPNIAKLSIVSFESSSGIISDFANKVMHPSNTINKTYIATLKSKPKSTK